MMTKDNIWRHIMKSDDILWQVKTYYDEYKCIMTDDERNMMDFYGYNVNHERSKPKFMMTDDDLSW